MLEQFFADLLPQRGNYAAFEKRNKRHTWVASHADLEAALDKLVDVPDVYFTTAAFGDAISPLTGDIARKQTNVIARRALHADIDCGAAKFAKEPEAAYATQRDGVVALRAFEKATGLTFTYVLSSGEGIHAYLALTEDMDHTEWTKLAKHFHALAKQVGFKLDSHCTCDSARVLRTPGSLHNNGQRVRVIQRRDSFYEPASLDSLIVSLLDEKPLPEGKKRKRTSINDDVLKVEGPPRSLLNIAPKCGAMRHALRKRGDVTEPYWRAMIGVIKYTVEGVDAAHKYSGGHGGYDFNATQEKYDRWETPPTTCAEFGKYSSACATCPAKGTIKSPILLGNMTTPQVEDLPEEIKPAASKAPEPTGDAWDGAIPKGFKVVAKDGHHLLVWSMPVERDNEDGDPVTVYVDVPVTHEIFWFGQWADAEHSDDIAKTVMHKWDGGSVCTYTFDQTLLGNQPKFREFLAGKAILAASHKQSVKAMEEYAKAQHQRIKALGRKPKINGRLGLRILPDGQLVAAQGGYVIFPNGEIREAMLGTELKALSASFTIPLPARSDGMWGPEVWESHITPAAQRHAAFLRKHYSAPGLGKFRLAAMMALASPLQAFVTGEYTSGVALPPTGLTVSLYSNNGGRGKTTLMRAAMLAYGKPNAMTRDANELGSTEKARIARMSLMGTTPIGMDEMGDNSAKATASLISAIANGTSREGATVNGGLRMGTTWSLMCLIGTNKSQRDMIAAASSESPAIQYRLLELDVEKVPEFDNDARAEFSKEWSDIADTAGALGAVIHHQIASVGVENINKVVLRYVNAAAKKVGADQTARFQYRGLGAVLALNALLRRAKIELFSDEDLVAEFKEAHDEAISFVSENILPTDELELLNLFLNDMHEFTVVTRGLTRRDIGERTVDIPLGHDPKDLRVRHVVDLRKSYVSGDALRQWCQEKHVQQSRLIKVALDNGIIERPAAQYAGESRLKDLFNLRRGMATSTGARKRCLTINVGKLNQALGKGYDEPVSEGGNVVEMRRTGQPVPTVQDQPAAGGVSHLH